MRGQDAMHVWLNLGHFLRTDEAHTREPVFNCSRMKGSQNLGFVVIECNDELAVLVEGEPTSSAVRLEHLSPARHSVVRSDPGA
jgi:hypothetical protein